MRKRKTSQVSFQNQLLDQNMEQYINIKVCYCKIYITDTYLHIVIQLPHLKDLDQKIPSFPNCDNYRIHRASNPNSLNDDTKTNDNELHQQLRVTFNIDYLQEMDIITKVKGRLECKINVTLPALLPTYLPSTKLYRIPEGW